MIVSLAGLHFLSSISQSMFAYIIAFAFDGIIKIHKHGAQHKAN
jgi:hypothetical protein